jgi:hypothetical protein
LTQRCACICGVLARYADFFQLFGDFRGYVSYFLLQDLVTEDCGSVKFFSPFENFSKSPIPATLDAYQAYRRSASDWIKARNERILRFCQQ